MGRVAGTASLWNRHFRFFTAVSIADPAGRKLGDLVYQELPARAGAAFNPFASLRPPARARVWRYRTTISWNCRRSLDLGVGTRFCTVTQFRDPLDSLQLGSDLPVCCLRTMECWSSFESESIRARQASAAAPRPLD